MDMVSVEPALGVFKRGDDFACCLEEAKGDTEAALRAYADFLRSNAAVIDAIADALKGREATADADTHMIVINMPKDVAESLSALQLVHIEEDDDWECCCDDDDEEEEDEDEEEEDEEKDGGKDAE